jgi:hypothetical protein
MTLDCPRLPECQEETKNCSNAKGSAWCGAYMAKKPKTSVEQRARERISKELLKWSPVVTPDPEPVLVADVAVAWPKHTAKAARQRHAQLAAAARFGADPGMV